MPVGVVANRREAENICTLLRYAGYRIKAAYLHAAIAPASRRRILNNFLGGKTDVLFVPVAELGLVTRYEAERSADNVGPWEEDVARRHRLHSSWLMPTAYGLECPCCHKLRREDHYITDASICVFCSCACKDKLTCNSNTMPPAPR